MRGKLAADEIKYFECQYPTDLAHMFRLFGTDIPVVGFTKTRHPMHIREWTEHFDLVLEKVDFLFCLFLHVLLDQYFFPKKGPLTCNIGQMKLVRFSNQNFADYSQQHEVM